MANEKLLQTRISLKYDTYANWTDTSKADAGANLVLKKGEVGFCEIPTGNTEATNAPTVLFKVGDGTRKFSELNWASALAADVHAWAKKSEAEFLAWAKGLVPIEVIDNGTGKFVTDVTATNDANGHHITITRADVAWGDITGKPNLVNSVKTTDDDIVVLTPETAASGDVTITGAHAKKGPSAGYTGSTNIKGGTAVVGTELDIKVPVLTVDAYGHTNAVNEASYKITIPKATAPNDGELTLKAGNGLTATEKVFTANDPNNVTFEVSHANTSDAANLVADGRKYVTGLTFDDYGHVTGYTTGTEADQDLSNYKTLQTAVSDPTASGKSLTFIDTISQNANGVISATKKNVNLDAYALKTDIPTIPSITITDDASAETPTGDTVDVYKNLIASGHTLTEELVSVPTKAYVDKMVAGAVDYLGTVSSASGLSTTAGKGDFYRASVKFTLGTEEVHVGDMLIALLDKPTQDLSGWDVAHLEVDTDTWVENSVSADGYVKKGQGQAYKVWSTDKDGNPAWRWLDGEHLNTKAVQSHEQIVIGDELGDEDAEKYIQVTHPAYGVADGPAYTQIAPTTYAQEAIDEAFNTLEVTEYTSNDGERHTVDINFKQKDGTVRDEVEFLDGDYIKIAKGNSITEIVVDVQDSVKTSLEKADKSLNAENLYINDDCAPEDNFWAVGLYNNDGGDYIGTFGFTTEDGIEVRQEKAHDCKVGLSETIKASLGKADTAIQSASFAGTAFTKSGTALSITQADARSALGLGTAAYHAQEDFVNELAVAENESAQATLELKSGNTPTSTIVLAGFNGIEVESSNLNNAKTIKYKLAPTVKNAIDGAVQTVTAPAKADGTPNGIVANRTGNDVTLAIDDTITWIFDCGGAAV